MLLIVASSADEVARQLAVRWKEHDACLLTPLDLSREGWQYHLPVSSSQGTVLGRSFSREQIRGVLSRLPRVCEEDIPHIVAEDRGYVAAEMTAFLTAWLSWLPCPVLNEVTTTCLAGPDWRRERWVHLAAQLGMKVRRMELTTGSEDERLDYGHLTAITIFGDRVLGDANAELASRVRRMALVAGVGMLTAYFDSGEDDAELVDASPWPDLSTEPASALVLEYLLRGSHC